jgi:hypothetical protein
METALIKIAESFGIPVALLAVGVLAVFKVGKFSASEVVKPLTAAAVAYLNAQTNNQTALITEVIQPLTAAAIAHMAIQQKATASMAAILEAIHSDQLRLLERYDTKGIP